MRNNKILIRQFMIFAIVFVGLAMTNTQMIPFLIDAGYSPEQRGVLLSAMAFVSIFGQLWAGYLCDRYQTVKRFFNLFMILFVIANAAMYWVTEYNFFFHLLAVSMMGGFFRIVSGLLETWTIETSQYSRDNFGMIRAFGSIGWAIGAPITSWILSAYGYRAIGLSFAIFALLSMLVSRKMPDAHKVVTGQSIRFRDVKQLVEHKPYLLLLVIFVLVNIVFTADMYTVIDKILALGGTNDDVAFKWSFQAITELPLFFLGAVVLKWMGGKKMMIFAIFMYFIRFFLYAVATTPFQLVMISGLQFATFPLLMVVQKVLIDDESPAHLKSSGQMFALSLYGGLSALLTPLLSGFLVGSFGYDFTLYALAFSLLVPLGLSFLYKPKSKLKT